MNAAALAVPISRAPSRLALAAESLAARGGLLLLAAALLVFLTVPLAMILVRSVEGRAGEFVGIANFVQYVQSPALAQSTWNTLTFACLTTLVTVPFAFLFAYAMQRSCVPFKGLFRNIAMIPILAPSLLAAISFIYLFGNQGALKFMLGWVGLNSIYGMPGMVLAMTFASFPHAVMILMAALALSDARLYEAADSLGTSEIAQIHDDHAARRKVRTDFGQHGGLHDGGVRVRRAEGDRRQHERAGGRHLQAGDRPAEFLDGRRCRPGAAAAGGARPSSSTASCSGGSRRC